MPAPSPPAVPADLRLWLDLGLGAVGSCPGAVVTLVPYPESNRLWAEVFWTRTGAFTRYSRTFAPGVLMLQLLVDLAVNDIDARELFWVADFDTPAADRNPFTTPGAA